MEQEVEERGFNTLCIIVTLLASLLFSLHLSGIGPYVNPPDVGPIIRFSYLKFLIFQTLIPLILWAAINLILVAHDGFSERYNQVLNLIKILAWTTVLLAFSTYVGLLLGILAGINLMLIFILAIGSTLVPFSIGTLRYKLRERIVGIGIAIGYLLWIFNWIFIFY